MSFEDPVRAREDRRIELRLPARSGELRFSKQCFRNQTLGASDRVLREGYQTLHGKTRERRAQDGTLAARYRASRERDQGPSVGRWKHRLRHQVRLLRYVDGSSPHRVLGEDCQSHRGADLELALDLEASPLGHRAQAVWPQRRPFAQQKGPLPRSDPFLLVDFPRLGTSAATNAGAAASRSSRSAAPSPRTRAFSR